MAKVTSQTFFHAVLLTPFIVFLALAAKDETSVSGRNGTKGTSATERFEPAGDMGYKKMLGQTSKVKRKPTPGFIYLIKMVGSPAYPPPRLVKVGRAADPYCRRCNLGAGNPFKLEFVGLWKVTDAADAEGSVHYVLTEVYDLKINLGGGTEWFKVPPKQDGLQEVYYLVENSIGDLLDYDKSQNYMALSFVY